MEECSQKSRLASIQCHHPSIKREQAFGVRKFRKWRSTTDYGYRSRPLRHGHGSRISIRCAAGDREHSKFVDVEGVNDPFHKTWPISQLSMGLHARATNARLNRSDGVNQQGEHW